jgi:hypothetical protein
MVSGFPPEADSVSGFNDLGIQELRDLGIRMTEYLNLKLLKIT